MSLPLSESMDVEARFPFQSGFCMCLVCAPGLALHMRAASSAMSA